MLYNMSEVILLSIAEEKTLYFLWAVVVVMGLVFLVLLWMALIRFVRLTGHLNRFFDDLEYNNTKLSKIVMDRTYMLSVLSEIEKNKFEKEIKQ